MDSGQLSTNPQLPSTPDQSLRGTALTCWLELTLILNLTVSAEEHWDTTCWWWELMLVQALTRKGADANECICGSLTSLRRLMP